MPLEIFPASIVLLIMILFYGRRMTEWNCNADDDISKTSVTTVILEQFYKYLHHIFRFSFNDVFQPYQYKPLVR